MQYRNIFMEFMYEYREYFADCIQLIVLENNKNNDLINYFSEFEEVHVFQSKDIQVFYKKRSFNDIQNTVLELALMDDVPQVHELNDINDLVDIYNGETLEKKTSRFVYIKPIINDTSLKAVLVVYSNFPTEWMVNDKKLIKLCDALQLSLSDDLYQDIEKNAKSKYWLLKNDKYYLSKELAKLIGSDQFMTEVDLKGFGLLEIDNIEFSNSTLISYELNKLPKLESRFELSNISFDEYSLLYLESDENELFEEFYERLTILLNQIDGQYGKYHLYQIDNQHIILIYEKVYSKKQIEEQFNQFAYILVRSGNEIKQKVDFKMLIEYLTISPIEPFNYEYYKYFCDNYNASKVKQVLNKTSNSKIKIIPIFDSLNSLKKGYLIKDSANIKLFDKTTKQKSLLSLFKIAEDYKNDVIYLELPLSYLFEDNKLSLSMLNKLHKFIDNNKERVFIITNYSKLLNKIYSHWPEFNKYLYFYDIPTNLYQSFLSIKDGNGLYINSLEYREFFNSNNIVAGEFLKFVIQNAKQILINVKKTDIIKYQQDNLLLVCE